MMGQITRALLFMLLLLTGMSATDLSRVENPQGTAAEEMALVPDLVVAAQNPGPDYTGLLPVSGEIRDEHRAERFITYVVASDAFPSTTPPSRHDVART
jgi:hypothetical protein